MRTSVLVLAILFSITMVSRASAADTPAPVATAHAAAQSALDAALQQHTETAAADRAAVLRVLDRAAVKEVAGHVGVDLRQAKSAVATLDGAQLAQVTAQARAVDQALAGGASTVVISTTTIIIALLLLILIIVAVN